MAHDRNALWASGYDETVEVNQRALIDKVLARYSGEFTVFRELLQNSDDAQSSAVELYFETDEYLKRKNIEDASQPETDTPFPNLKTTQVSQWTFRNNGRVFRDEDWSRLRKIAEGNPDEEKIGAFGVGFYSLFSVTEEPFVTSGGHGMQFYWKDKTGDQLFVRRGELPSRNDSPPDPWTTFEMILREQTPIPQPFDLTRFIASSITFMAHIRSVSIFIDSHRLAHLTKSSGAPKEFGLLRGLGTSSDSGLMNVTRVQSAVTRIQAEVMHGVYDLGTEKPPALPAEEPRKPLSRGGFFSSLFNTFTSHHQAALTQPLPQPHIEKDPKGVYTSNVTLTIFTAEVNVKLDKKLQSELHRSTKKNPPNRLNYSLIYTGKDEYDLSVEEEKNLSVPCGSVFQGLRADLNGAGQAHVFIGHATGQTTGIGGHMASRFIPTVERESIDLVDRNVAVWNRELLYVGGYLCRTAYEIELESIRTLWNEAGVNPHPQHSDRLHDRFLHVFKFFTFHMSTPSSDVARFLETAFFSCSTLPLRVLSTVGVRDASDVRAPDPIFLQFLKHLPVLPDRVLSSAPAAFRALRNKGMIADITFQDVLAQLRKQPLDEEELVACLKWWVEVGQQDSVYTHARAELLNATILNLGSGQDTRVVPLSMVKYFIHQRMIPLDGPLPNTLLPLSVTKHFTPEQLKSFGWGEFLIPDWIEHIFRIDVMNANPKHNITKSSEWAERVLTVLARVWPSLSKESHERIKAILAGKTCIPTSSGLQKPELSYFSSANIFNDLPVVTFTSGVALKGNMEKLLSFIGVRKHVDLQVVFDRMVKTGDWTISDLITHLVTIQSTLTPEEITKLQMTSAFSKEGENTLPGKRPRYRASDLYEPHVTNRQLGLPIIDWGEKTKWRSSSEEARLLYRLGLRRSPPLDLTIKLCASSEPDIRSAAFKYLTDNIPSKYPDYKYENFADIAFIPAVNDLGPLMGTLNEVFASRQWKTLGFSVVQDAFRDVAVRKLCLKENPPATRIVALLEKTPPQDQEAARQWFEILAGHVSDFSSSQLLILSRLPIVPTSIENDDGSRTLRWLPPTQCYLGGGGASKGQSHSKLFIFVDFGPSANSFLSACGSKQEPSVDEVAGILVADPRRFYDLTGGYENYLIELRNLAVNARVLSTSTISRMKISPILLGFRRQKTLRKESNKAIDLEEEDWELLHDLRKPLDIVIADDTNAYQLFGESIYTAPQEDLLEDFYVALGSKRLSNIIKEDYKVKSEMKDNRSAIDIRTLLLERLPLFLHEHTHARTKVTLSWLSNEQHFKVKVFSKLTVVKSLSFGDHTLIREQDASAAAKRVGHGPIELWLSGSTQVDMYEIATSLCRLLFETAKVNDALLFMTILSTDLKALKRRGYNVDKILRQQQNERKMVEEKRIQASKTISRPDSRMSRNLEPESRLSSPPPRAGLPGSWDPSPLKAIASKPSSPPPHVSPPPVRLPNPSTSNAHPQIMANDEDTGRHPMIPNLNNTLQNIRRKLPGFIGPSEDAPIPLHGSSSSPRAPPTVTPQSNIRSNVAMAIKGCRPEEGKLVHNRREMQTIKEALNEGYCDVSGYTAELDHIGSMGTMKIFVARDVPEPGTFMTRKRDPLARFIHVVTPLANVYNLPMTALHIFCDVAGGLIAFNRNGSLFLNLRFFEAWHDHDVTNGDTNQAHISWYFTLAHEIAHNLVQPHNSEHEFYFSALCEAHIEKFTQIISS